MAVLTDVLRRGTVAAQPAATAVAAGTLYCQTDGTPAFNVQQSNGTAWNTYAPGGSNVRSVGITIDGGGSVITTGVKGYIQVPYACTITGNTLLSTDGTGPATSGSIVIDIWKVAYASYPPTVANTITASAKPTLSSARNSTDSTLTGWTTAISAGDVLGFNVDSVSTVTRVTLELKVTT